MLNSAVLIDFKLTYIYSPVHPRPVNPPAALLAHPLWLAAAPAPSLGGAQGDRGLSSSCLFVRNGGAVRMR